MAKQKVDETLQAKVAQLQQQQRAAVEGAKSSVSQSDEEYRVEIDAWVDGKLAGYRIKLQTSRKKKLRTFSNFENPWLSIVLHFNIVLSTVFAVFFFSFVRL